MIKFLESNVLIDDVSVRYSIFPAGELNVVLDTDKLDKNPMLTLLSPRAEDIMVLCLTVDALRSYIKFPTATTVLTIPYLPYSRQDRVCNLGEAFSLRAFAAIINSLNIPHIITHDVHSNVALDLINNLISVEQSQFVSPSTLDSYDLLVAPDKGALPKIQLYGKSYIYADKARSNGQIDITVHGDCQGKSCLIVDDICDGGGTFIALAEKLKKAGAAKIGLHVTHGLFTAGLQRIYDSGIDEIYSVNYKTGKGEIK